MYKVLTAKCHFSISNFINFIRNHSTLNQKLSTEEWKNNFSIALIRGDFLIPPANLSLMQSADEIILIYKFISDIEPDQYWNRQEVFRCDIRNFKFANVSKHLLLQYGGTLFENIN